MKCVLSGLALLMLGCHLPSSHAVLDAMSHSIKVITPQNFDGLIRKHRDVNVAALLLYKSASSADKTTAKTYIDGWFNEAASESHNMFTIGAVDCSDHPNFCKELHSSSDKLPTVLMFPPNPIPVMEYQGKPEAKALMATLSRYVPTDNVKAVTNENIEEFTQQRIDIPKVFLFSNKPKPATLYNALATSFRKEMHFGFVDTEKYPEIAKRYNVNTSKLPQIVLTRPQSKRPERYTGKIQFTALHDWVNLFRETFVKDGGFSGEPEEATGSGSASGGKQKKPAKPWLDDPLPELNEASAGPMCFKKSDKSLCVIYITDGNITPADRNALIGLKERFVTKIDDRGLGYKWMWLDASAEPEFKELFGVEKLPSAVVFNPNKRLRFMRVSEEPADVNSVVQLLDRIAGGDARFKNVGELPQWKGLQKEDQHKRDEL